MPDKNVQLPDGRIVAFPDSMADADISAVIKKQLAPQTTRQFVHGMSVNATTTTPEEFKGELKSDAELIGSLAGGGAATGVRGVAGVLARILGAGAGASVGNAGAQESETGKVNLSETARTGLLYSLLQGGGEAVNGLANLKSTLSNLIYSGKVASDGTPELSKVARAIVHPTELPENIVRAVVPPPQEAVAAAKAQAGEANAATLESRMNEAQAARQKELADWERLKNQEAQSLMNRGKQQAALDAQTAKNAPAPQQPSAFPGATSTANTPEAEAQFQRLFGREYKEAGDLAQWETGSREGSTAAQTQAGWQMPQGNPTPFGQPKLVSKFEAPEPSRLVTPLSPPPPVNRTLVSYDRNLLVHMARGGDLNALRELIRNPGGINVSEAVPNSRYLLGQQP